MWGSLDPELWSRSQFFQPTFLDTQIFSPETAQIHFFLKDPVFEYFGGRWSAKPDRKARRVAVNVILHCLQKFRKIQYGNFTNMKNSQRFYT